jgi:predicted transcriptional regulator YdeE/GNAT superfamily N-acetyltransferase
MRIPFIILSIARALVSSPLLAQNISHSGDKTHLIEEHMMENEIVQKPAILVIGIDCRTSNAPEAGPQDIPKLWGKFYGEDIINQIPNKISDEVIALYCDYEGDYTQPYSVVIGCPVSSIDTIPEGMVAKIIPPSSYAVFHAIGEHPKALIETWSNIWKQSSLKRTYASDFEVYGNKFVSGSPKEVEVYIGIDNQEGALLQSVIQGRFDTFRSGSVCSSLPEAAFKETDQNYLYAWGMDYVCGNGIIEKNGERIPTEEEIDRVIEYFSSKNLPFMWWSSAKILETKGFQFGGIFTGIALDISQGVPSKPTASSDLKIKIVESDTELKSFTNLAANAFALSPKATEQWLALNHSVMKKNEQVHFMAYLNGVPVGTASLSLAPSSAGIWSLATLPEYRKHGIGSALVHAALVEAKKHYHNQVMAILMPKGMAWGVFTKMGFKAVYEFPFYIYGVSAEELEK